MKVSAIKADAKARALHAEKMAREAEIQAGRPDVAEDVRRDALDAAKAYWQMAANWHATAERAETISPERFTARNSGPQKLTKARADFLRTVAEDIGTTKRDLVVSAAEGRPGFVELFGDYARAYRFAVPKIFDGIQIRAKPTVSRRKNP